MSSHQLVNNKLGMRFSHPIRIIMLSALTILGFIFAAVHHLVFQLKTSFKQIGFAKPNEEMDTHLHKAEGST